MSSSPIGLDGRLFGEIAEKELSLERSPADTRGVSTRIAPQEDQKGVPCHRIAHYTGTVNWIGIVSLVGAAQGFFIAYLVLAHTKQRRANLWLGLFVAAYAALCLGDALNNSGLAPRYPDVTALFDFCIFLLGPLLYQYVRILTGRQSLGDLLWVHLIPAGVTVLMLVLFHCLPLEEKRRLVTDELASQGRTDPLMFLAALQILAYLFAALFQLRRYALALKERYSSIERLSFTWLRNFLLVNTVLWLIWSTAMLTHSRVALALDYIGFPLAAYVLAAFALRAPEVLIASDAVDLSPTGSVPAAPQETAENIPKANTPESLTMTATQSDEVGRSEGAKYQKSRLPEAILMHYEKKLAALMNNNKAYLESELTLMQLANRLGISSHHLSQLLNERLKVTFFDYVNQLRVEEVKRLLCDPASSQKPILELAFEAGFSSKSTFNSIFKRVTGQSPSVYRRLSPPHSTTPEARTSRPTGSDDNLGSTV